MNRCFAALALVFGFTSAASAADTPNVVVFLADDLGYSDLGCYGHPRIKTPNLDAFAKEGVRLTQCYAASAVCSPSRSAILTGRTPHRNGVYTWIAEGSEVHLRTSEIALPKLLKEAGYATCHVGKWHLNGKFNDPAQPQPNDHGYDHWMATQNNAGPSHMNPTNFVRNGKPVGKLEGFSAPLVADEAIDWLKTGRDKAKPFFLAVWAHEPHLPIETDPEFQKPYADLDEDLRQHHGNVSQLDHAFGKLMRALDEQKLTDTTFVFFTSDNGPEGDGLKNRTRGSTGGAARAEAGDVRGRHPRARHGQVAGAHQAEHYRRRPGGRHRPVPDGPRRLRREAARGPRHRRHRRAPAADRHGRDRGPQGATLLAAEHGPEQPSHRDA
jgi:arylsulfatase A